MTAAERFKKRIKGGAPHTVKKNNNETEDLSFLTSPKQPDYTKFLAEPSWMRNK
tara:strand:- start:4491 stop:4652 length:162 start_codon:yes stop_codon:yes gene_type:complete